MILTSSLTASSSLLRSNGIIPASTSSASIPEVAGVPKHKAKHFLWILSSCSQFPICHTVDPYSRWGRTILLYSLSIFSALICSDLPTIASEAAALVAFLSIASICF